MIVEMVTAAGKFTAMYVPRALFRHLKYVRVSLSVTPPPVTAQFIVGRLVVLTALYKWSVMG